MKLYVSICLLAASLTAQAASRVQFYPGNFNMSVNVTELDMYGNRDNDAQDLYLTMNVDEQDSMMGKGKSIVTTDRDFNMVCAKEKKHCSIILKRSPNVVIDSNNKYASFKLKGDLAKQLTGKFKLNERGEAFFTATDKAFHLYGNSEEFTFEAKAE